MNPERLESKKPLEMEPVESQPEVKLPESQQPQAETLNREQEVITQYKQEEVPEVKDIRQDNAEIKAIEESLADGLAEAYRTMDEQRQASFKIQGEKLAIDILGMLPITKKSYRKIQQGIRDWIFMIPNVDNHFVDQETKIKLDAIMEFERERA